MANSGRMSCFENKGAKPPTSDKRLKESAINRENLDMYSDIRLSTFHLCAMITSKGEVTPIFTGVGT